MAWACIVVAAVAVAAEPDVGVKAPEGEGWRPLFNGADLTGWKIPKGDSGHWKAVDGLIDYDACSEAKGQKNLWTEEAFGDFILRIDWRLKATSGEYPMPVNPQDEED